MTAAGDGRGGARDRGDRDRGAADAIARMIARARSDGGGSGDGTPRGTPRIPPPRAAAEDGAVPPAAPPPGGPAGPAGPPGGTADGPERDHRTLTSLLGAWALDACSAEEEAAVEAHLNECARCAEEALRLRDAAALLRPEDSLDLEPSLRGRVLSDCLVRRPARIPLPSWAAPFDAETARLDALLRDMDDTEWEAPVRLRWFDGREQVARETTVAGVLGHLRAVDGLVARALGLPDPLHEDVVHDPSSRTEAYWSASRTGPAARGRAARGPWREQTYAMTRTASFTGDADHDAARNIAVSYGEGGRLPLQDAFLDRTFECWVHAGDIADAVAYPYDPPAPEHLGLLVDLAARMLPHALAGRRQAGLAAPPPALGVVGAPGRTLLLEVEGTGAGARHWLVPLDSPGAAASPDHEVAHVAIDAVEFCKLAAGHVRPEEAAAGQSGDRRAVLEALAAVASLSRL